ncbi:unnamed protein product, partial [Effrenium voratum]
MSALQAKAVGSERSPGRIDGLLEASEWRAAKEAYGPWHLKSLRAALRLGELLEAPRAEALLRHAAAGLEATLGLHVDTLRAWRNLSIKVPEEKVLRQLHFGTEA